MDDLTEDSTREGEAVALVATPAGAAVLARPVLEDPGSLSHWLRRYWDLHVQGTPRETARAKDRDLRRFLRFFVGEVGGDALDDWTPAVTRAFVRHMVGEPSDRTGQPLQPASVNRVLATLGTFARWLGEHRPLLAGDPFAGVKAVATDSPTWRGLTPRQVRRLQMACEQRLAACGRGDQVPLLEAAVFYVLLHTGLREHELVRLDMGDYHHRAFHQVKRKGSRVSRRVPVPADARLHLERYLSESRAKLLAKSGGLAEGQGPLLASRRGGRLTTRAVAYICARLARYACASLTDAERFHLAPHQLRHTFLKRVADKHGLHHAQELSGNVSMREIFRYTKPSDEEMAATAEGLFA